MAKKKKLVEYRDGGDYTERSPYNAYFGNVEYSNTPIEYRGLPLEEIKSANAEIRNRYLTEKARQTELDILNANMKVLEEDTPYKDKLISDVDNIVSKVKSDDTWDRSTAIVDDAVKRVMTDKPTQQAQSNYQTEMEFIKSLEDNKDLGQPDKDTWHTIQRSKYKGVQVSPTGLIHGVYNPDNPAAYADRRKHLDEMIKGWNPDKSAIHGGINYIGDGLIKYTDGTTEYIRDSNILEFSLNTLAEYQPLYAWKDTEGQLDAANPTKAITELITAGYKVDEDLNVIGTVYDKDAKGNSINPHDAVIYSLKDAKGNFDNKQMSRLRDYIAAADAANKYGYTKEDLNTKLLDQGLARTRLADELANKPVNPTGAEIMDLTKSNIANDIPIYKGKTAGIVMNIFNPAEAVMIEQTGRMLLNKGVTKQQLNDAIEAMNNGDGMPLTKLIGGQNATPEENKANELLVSIAATSPYAMTRLKKAMGFEDRYVEATDYKTKNLVGIVRNATGKDVWNSMSEDDKEKKVEEYVNSMEKEGVQIGVTTYDPKSEKEWKLKGRESGYLFGRSATDGTFTGNTISTNLQNRRIFKKDTREEVTPDELGLNAKSNTAELIGTLDDNNPYGNKYKQIVVNGETYIVSPSPGEEVDNVGWAIYGTNRNISGIGDKVLTPRGEIQSIVSPNSDGTNTYKVILIQPDGQQLVATGNNLNSLHDAIMNDIPVFNQPDIETIQQPDNIFINE